MSDQVSLIASRVESLEGRFEDNISKINNRLDQIVDLMQKVTQLQEREIKNADQIIELKQSMKELTGQVKEWNQRIHERMDKNFDDIAVCREGLVQTIKNLEDEMEDRIRGIEQENSQTRAKFEQWLNRFIGGWAIASILIVALHTAAGYIITGILEDDKKTSDKVDRLEIKVYDTERQYHDIRSDFLHLKEVEDKEHGR